MKIQEADCEYEILEITSLDAAKMKRMGRAEGQDFNHCLFIAMRHNENFAKRCRGYVPVKPLDEKMAAAFEFFEF